jgi:hypothetical protein
VLVCARIINITFASTAERRKCRLVSLCNTHHFSVELHHLRRRETARGVVVVVVAHTHTCGCDGECCAQACKTSACLMYSSELAHTIVSMASQATTYLGEASSWIKPHILTGRCASCSRSSTRGCGGGCGRRRRLAKPRHLNCLMCDSARIRLAHQPKN